MRSALHRLPLERAIQVAIVLTILTTVLASGAILPWQGPFRKVRWVALFALTALAVAHAVSAPRRRQPPVSLYAAAAAFLALALVSIGWSAEPRLTAARAISLAILFTAAGALSYATAGRPEAIERVLAGVLSGAVAVALGGLVVLAFEPDRAIQAATVNEPARYQGLGGGPNTVPMVLAVGMPLAGAALLGRGSRFPRATAGGALALLAGSIVASGSRGALVAGFGGLLVVALLTLRRLRARLIAVAAVAMLFAVGIVVTRLPDPDRNAAAPPQPPEAVEPAVTGDGYLNANFYLRLQDDIGHPPFGVAAETKRRTLLGSSGRAQAWEWAFEQGLERPLLGFGFGLEHRAFVDRLADFQSDLPENSYLGLFLQLGALGVAVFLGLVAVLVLRAATALRRLGRGKTNLTAACGGALAVALLLGLSQSYIYSVGNVATASVWICVFLLVATTIADRPVGRGAS